MTSMPRIGVKLAVPLIAWLAMLPPAAAEDASSKAGVPPAALERARKVADDLTLSLKSRLLQELSSGGPTSAVKVCSVVAPSIAAEHSKGGVLVRRVSLKVRNPDDQPDGFERAWLEKLESLQRDGVLPKEVAEVTARSGLRELRYLRPIVIAETCLACHGPRTKLDPQVRKVLAERYPKDAATGYALGDLRGAVSVTVPLEGSGKE
jgi:hypothetical protein